MPSVRPFQFTGLPRYSRDQIALQQSLQNYLSRRPFQPKFAESLAGMLEKYVKVPCKVTPPEVKTLARRDLPAVVPKLGCFVVVGLAPSTQKVIVDLDMGVASFVIERLLGGSGESDRIQRALTEIEEGVLSFLFLKVLQHFYDGLSHGKELAPVLDRFASKLEDLQATVDAENDYVMLGSRVAMGRALGYARLFLPGSMITERFGKTVAQNGAQAADRAYMVALLESMGDTAVAARVEMATIDLGPDDLAHLETGDIVLLENHQIKKSPEGIEGTVFIKLGTGKNGGLRGRVQDGSPTRVEITEIVRQEQPPEEPMVDDGAAADGENLAETEGLLRDVPAPVVVELGRIRMNTAQVMRLRQGQILRLPRGSNDPVDLVVNGKLFARGELIEVDGELGVRLLQLVGG